MAETQDADWKTIEADYRNGVTSRKLSDTHKVTDASIRQRAKRCGWSRLTEGLNEKAAKRAVNTLVKQEVARIKPGARLALSTAIQDCLDESIGAAREVVSQARRRAIGCEDKDFNSIASGLEKGVNIWRLTHGLDVTQSGGQGCAVNLQFVMRGPGEVQSIEAVTGVTRDTLRDEAVTPIEI